MANQDTQASLPTLKYLSNLKSRLNHPSNQEAIRKRPLSHQSSRHTQHRHQLKHQSLLPPTQQAHTASVKLNTAVLHHQPLLQLLLAHQASVAALAEKREAIAFPLPAEAALEVVRIQLQVEAALEEVPTQFQAVALEAGVVDSEVEVGSMAASLVDHKVDQACHPSQQEALEAAHQVASAAGHGMVTPTLRSLSRQADLAEQAVLAVSVVKEDRLMTEKKVLHHHSHLALGSNC